MGSQEKQKRKKKKLEKEEIMKRGKVKKRRGKEESSTKCVGCEVFTAWRLMYRGILDFDSV